MKVVAHDSQHGLLRARNRFLRVPHQFHRMSLTLSALQRSFGAAWIFSAGLLVCLVVELLSGAQQHGIFIAQTHAYKVEQVCKTVSTKKGDVEKCSTKLVAEDKSQGETVKPASAKDQNPAKK